MQHKLFKGTWGLSQHNRMAHPVETRMQQAYGITRWTHEKPRLTAVETREMARLEDQHKVDKTPNIIVAIDTSSMPNRSYDDIKGHRVAST